MIFFGYICFICVILGVVCENDLENYLNQTDSNFRILKDNIFTEIIVNHTYTYKYYEIPFSSLKWQSEDLWNHTIFCVQNLDINETATLVYINSTQDMMKMHKSISKWDLLKLSTTTKAMTCMISNLFNQPVKIDGEKRTGLSILAYMWNKYLDKPNIDYLMHFPLTKAVIYGLNVIESITNSTGRKNIFLSGDGLMNGYTAYLVSAMDKRVNTIIPTNVDINLKDFFLNVWAQLCYWPDSLKSFEESDFLYKIITHSSELKKLSGEIDPFYYNVRSTKYILNYVHDTFFLTLQAKSYYNGLKGRNYLHYSVQPINDSIVAKFVRSELNNQNSSNFSVTPILRWKKISGDDSRILKVEITTSNSSCRFYLYTMFNPTNFDFRLSAMTGEKYSRKRISLSRNVTTLKRDESEGFKAFFISMECYGNNMFVVTTDVLTLPGYPCKYPPTSRWGTTYNWIVLAGVIVILSSFTIICLICFCVYCAKQRVIKEYRQLFNRGGEAAYEPIQSSASDDQLDEEKEREKDFLLEVGEEEESSINSGGDNDGEKDGEKSENIIHKVYLDSEEEEGEEELEKELKE